MYNPGRIFSLPFSTKDMLVDALMNVIFVFACCSGVNFFLISSPEQTNQFFFSFLLIVPAVLMFFIRRLRLRFSFMLILHLIPALLPILLIKYDVAAENVFLMTLASIILMIYSFRFSFRNKREYWSASMVVVCVLVHIGLLLALTIRGLNQLYPYVLSEALFCICLYLAVRQIVRFQMNFDHFLLSPTQPAKKIYANNVRVILLLFLAALVIIPISVIFPYDYPLRLLKNIVSGIITGILFILSMGEESTAPDPEPAVTAGTGEVVNESAPTVLPGYIGQILDYIVFIITVIILIYAAYKIYHFVRRYIQSHYRKQGSDALRNQNANVTDEVISIRKNRNRGSKNARIFGTGEERKIRKLYYTTIKKEIRKGAHVTKASTAEEINKAVHAGSGEDISELTRAYEKIRYGFPHAPQK